MEQIHKDFSLATPEERVEKVKEIIANTPPAQLTPFFLEDLTKYILEVDKKLIKEEKEILTDNKMVTVNFRETSFEGLVEKFENSDNGNKDNIYNMITNDKNIIAHPKDPITQEDIDNAPGLKAVIEAIKKTEEQLAHAKQGQTRKLFKQLIDLRKDQYVLRNNYRQPIRCNSCIKSFSRMDFSEKITIDKNGLPVSTGIISFFNPKHISALLCNYTKLKEDSWSDLRGDCRWMLMDLENLIDRTLKDKYPLYYKLLIYKIDGRTNLEIQSLLFEEFGIKNTVEYISSLWRNKIPKLLSDAAVGEWLTWHYTQEEKGYWKKCGRCGQIKLGHNYFFSKNSTSKDKLYSICKECRNNRKKGD